MRVLQREIDCAAKYTQIFCAERLFLHFVSKIDLDRASAILCSPSNNSFRRQHVPQRPHFLSEGYSFTGSQNGVTKVSFLEKQYNNTNLNGFMIRNNTFQEIHFEWHGLFCENQSTVL